MPIRQFKPVTKSSRFRSVADFTEKRFKLIPEMEGRQARWYARQRRSGGQLAGYRSRAAELAATLPDGAEVLEVAPGPGYQAVELARGGRVAVHGVDVSRTMVEIAAGYAAEQGVAVDFRHGDVADLPFPDGSFDLVLTQAAFKNFTAPVRAGDVLEIVCELVKVGTRSRVLELAVNVVARGLPSEERPGAAYEVATR